MIFWNFFVTANSRAHKMAKALAWTGSYNISSFLKAFTTVPQESRAITAIEVWSVDTAASTFNLIMSLGVFQCLFFFFCLLSSGMNKAAKCSFARKFRHFMKVKMFTFSLWCTVLFLRLHTAFSVSTILFHHATSLMCCKNIFGHHLEIGIN